MRLRPSLKFCFKLLVVVAMLTLAFLALRPREPTYQGKRLSSWIREVTKPQREENLDTVQFRWQTLTNVVRAIGTKSLPPAIRWIRDKPRKSFYDDVSYRIEEAFRGRIALPERQDRSSDASLVFQILGTNAQAAILELAPLTMNDYTSSEACYCLSMVGAAAAPVLSNTLANATSMSRGAAIDALGELGPSARMTIPLLLHTIRNDRPAAWRALRALVEVETNSGTVLPLLIESFADTNTTAGAAYGLARLGASGIPPLLLAFTNSEASIRAAAQAALDPRFQKRATGEEPSDFYARSGLFQTIFNSRMLSEAILERTNSFPNVERGTIPLVLQHYASDTNAAIRSAAIEAIHHLESN